MKLEFRQLCFDIRAFRQFRKSPIGKEKKIAVVVEKVQQLEIRSEQTIHSESSQLYRIFQGLHSILP